VTVMVDVLIAGGGPVGMFLAAELGLAGVPTLVVDPRGDLTEADSPELRAVNTRTVHTLELRGLREELGETVEAASLGIGQRIAWLRETCGEQAAAAGEATVALLRRADGMKGHFGMLPFIDQTGEFKDLAVIPVSYASLIGIFERRARQYGVEFWQDSTVVDAKADEGGVVAELGDGREVRASYLVGADGGRSVVRKRSDFPFTGTGPTMFACGGELVAVADRSELPAGTTRTPAGVLMVDVVPGQIVAIEFDVAEPPARSRPTVGELQESIRKVSGIPVVVTDVLHPFRYTDNARQAATYRRGPVLLAGDAAHVHSPFGSQGLNLGLQDAANLGWKLALVARGLHRESLLDSYTSERHPVAERVLRNSRAQAALMHQNPQVDALREVLGEVFELPQAKQHFVDMLHSLDVRYQTDSGHPLAGAFLSARRVTDETAGYPLAGQLGDGRGLLFGMGSPIPLRELAGPWADRVRVVSVPEPARSGPAALLIRPDGYVAWAADGTSPAGLPAALEFWFGPGKAQGRGRGEAGAAYCGEESSTLRSE
jgi:2-polyprenyl-6-methoxyphenol hydroxylase-like FAD-dependent oxidoreductase